MENKIESLLQRKKFKDNIEYVFDIAGTDGDLRPFPDNLLPEIKQVLQQRNIRQLYSHQAESWEFAQKHQDFTAQ